MIALRVVQETVIDHLLVKCMSDCLNYDIKQVWIVDAIVNIIS